MMQATNLGNGNDSILFWFLNDQIRLPVRPYLRNPRPKYPILVLEFGSFDCSLLNSQLLAKSRIFQDQIASADKQATK